MSGGTWGAPFPLSTSLCGSVGPDRPTYFASGAKLVTKNRGGPIFRCAIIKTWRSKKSNSQHNFVIKMRYLYIKA